MGTFTISKSAAEALKSIEKELRCSLLVFNVAYDDDDPKEIAGIGVYTDADGIDVIEIDGFKFVLDDDLMENVHGCVLNYEAGKFFWS